MRLLVLLLPMCVVVTHATAFAADDEIWKKKSIAVLDLSPSTPADKKLADLATAAVTEQLGKRLPETRVIGAQEVAKSLELAATQALMGCSDERCVLDQSAALAVDGLVTGRVGTLQGTTLLFVALVVPKEGRVAARASQAVSDGDVKAAATLLARRLLDPNNVDGDTAFADMRVGVLVDELDAEGKPIFRRPMETCLTQRLNDAGAVLVSPAAIQAIRGKAGPRAILGGGVPEGVTSDDVDVLVVGAGDWETRKFRKTVKVTGTLSLQVINIDSGEVLVSESATHGHPAHSALKGQTVAAKKICQKLQPQLEAAMGRRLDRGTRIVVEVSGVKGLGAARKLANQLKTVKRVTRTRVRTVRGGKAIVDVTLAGGDGVSFALDTPSSLPLTLKEISAAKIVAAAN